MEKHISVYRTNITQWQQIRTMEKIISSYSGIEKWNVDIEDCDKVLRIEAIRKTHEKLISRLREENIFCEPM
jgi:hypothetical protein